MECRLHFLLLTASCTLVRANANPLSLSHAHTNTQSKPGHAIRQLSVSFTQVHPPFSAEQTDPDHVAMLAAGDACCWSCCRVERPAHGAILPAAAHRTGAVREPTHWREPCTREEAARRIVHCLPVARICGVWWCVRVGRAAALSLCEQLHVLSCKTRPTSWAGHIIKLYITITQKAGSAPRSC